MKKISLLLVCTICVFLLSGCWDKQELEDNTFVVFMGVDKADDTNIILTVAFPLTQTEEGGSSSQGQNNGGGSYSVMSVKASSIIEGLNMFSTKLAGPLALYSVKTIVMSQELIENDMMDQVLSSWRYYQIRNTTGILISKCKAADFIEARVNKSLIDPMRQEDLLLEQINDSSYYKPVQFLDLIDSIKSNSSDEVVLYGGIAAKDEEKSSEKKQDKENGSDSEGENKEGGTDTKDEDKNNDKQQSEEKSGKDTDIKEPVKKSYLPGEIPLKADNESQVIGLVVIHGNKMVGILDSAETQAYLILTQNKTKKILTLPDPLNSDKNIVVAVMPNGNKIKSVIQDDIPVFDIEIKLKCDVESIQSKIDYSLPQNFTVLEEYIKNVCTEKMQSFITKIQKEYEADILKLGNKLAYHFTTVDKWEQYNWPEKYKDAKINLNVKLYIENTGILIP